MKHTCGFPRTHQIISKNTFWNVYSTYSCCWCRVYDAASPPTTPYFVVLQWSQYGGLIQIFTHLTGPYLMRMILEPLLLRQWNPDNLRVDVCLNWICRAIYNLYSQVVCTSLVLVVSECVFCCYESLFCHATFLFFCFSVIILNELLIKYFCLTLMFNLKAQGGPLNYFWISEIKDPTARICA